ncbi:MAG: dihydroorotase [Actinobacteria bacterium]|nr:dihydroorotase [Actinomycetota bacterium]MBM3713203.1 dihydroorotase [Actinomycetota bacterium]
MMDNKKINTGILSGINNMLIKSVIIIDPFEEREYTSDILIENGIIRAVGTDLKIGSSVDFERFPECSRIKFADNLMLFDASGYHASPGFFDMHVHLREPGDEDEEDLESGISAALRGGITSVACMPNTDPPLDRDFLIKDIKNRASTLGFNVYPIAAATKGLEGIEMTEMGILRDSGAAAFSDDGKCIQNAKLMYEIMKYSKIFEMPLILHEEDYSFLSSGMVHDGYYSAALGLDGIPSLSEEIIVARDIMLAEKTCAQIHITHISSKRSVELIKKAKEKGINITCDVTPHHLYFDDSSLKDYNTNFKVNPPLRSSKDRQAIIEAVKAGVIDAIASDHAPHLETEKNIPFSEAANGVIGMETLFKAAYTILCKKGNLNSVELIKLLTKSPSKILKISTGKINPDLKADFVILDLERESVIRRQDFFSRSSNSAFTGEKLTGEIVLTVCNGKIGFLNNSVNLEKKLGNFR